MKKGRIFRNPRISKVNSLLKCKIPTKEIINHVPEEVDTKLRALSPNSRRWLWW